MTDDEIERQRDEVMRRMIDMPPKAHKDEPKRRASPEPIGRLIKDADEKRKRDKA
ncbi:hypothetical protein [Vitreimonas sp.]|uniref:hypothetical protein n=1 Tax=Vitreimonas sp. TaxID=3069702 RepID=UPI002EDA84E9